jgi:anti-anti-sigma regulatory factor
MHIDRALSVMSITPARLLVAVEGGTVFLKITGRASVACSVDFQKLVAGLKERGLSNFVCNLKDCLMMDSTFLGVLAGFSLKLMQSNPGAHEPRFVLANASERIFDSIDNMGMSAYFKFASDTLADHRYSETGPCSATKIDITRASLEAHELLMSLHPANVEKFKDVAEFLAEELKRLEKGVS